MDRGGGKLLAVIGDEVKLGTAAAKTGLISVVFCSFACMIVAQDTCTGFLLGGIGEMNAKRQPNFLVVDKGDHK